jgi:hypothetical protein
MAINLIFYQNSTPTDFFSGNRQFPQFMLKICFKWKQNGDIMDKDYMGLEEIICPNYILNTAPWASVKPHRP